MTVLSVVPCYHTIRCKGVVLGKRDSILVDGGATHNFIDAEMVEKRKIPSEPFYGVITRYCSWLVCVLFERLISYYFTFFSWF